MAQQTEQQATGDTSEKWYTDRLKDLGGEWTLIRRLHLRFYRRHIRALAKGRTLDVGCGIGGNLQFLTATSVGVDHNPTSVQTARERGMTAFVPDELHERAAEFTGVFDTMLCAHVMEHMDHETGVSVLEQYMPYMKPNARIVVLTPQDPRCENDPTHVRYVDIAASKKLVEAVGLKVKQAHGFPLPPALGKFRRNNSNEIVVVAER